MGSKYPSLAQIRNSYPKGKWEPIWTVCVLRPLSFPLAWLFIRLGFSANQVSLLAILVSLSATFLMATGVYRFIIIGALLFNLFALMDCVDGHIARVKNTDSVYGGWIDALGGYIAYSCVLLSGGIATEYWLKNASVGFNDLNFIIFGSVAAIANLLMRLEYQHYRCLEGKKAVATIKPFKKFGANLGVTGILMPAILFGVIWGQLHWVMLFYALFYVCACVCVSVVLISKVQKIQRNL